jgi:hypothetical protein
MAATESIRGYLAQHERPCWKALVRVLGHELASWFMWMFEVELADGTRLHAYKHVSTRRYVHLDPTGRAFHYDGGEYQEVAVPVAIARAFVGWERSGPSERDAVALRAAMSRARRAC